MNEAPTIETNSNDIFKYYKLSKDIQNSLLNINSIGINDIILSKELQNNKHSYGITNINDINHLLNTNNNIYEVMVDENDNRYFKLPLDIELELNNDIINDTNDKYIIDIINNIVDDIIIFFKDFIKIDIIKSNILITSSNGLKDNNIYRYSYHLILPVIFKWNLMKQLNNVLTNHIYNKYNLIIIDKFKLNNNKQFIDTSISKRNQLFRCINQTKYNSNRINTPIKINGYKYSTNIIDYLIGIYNTDNSQFKNIDNLNELIESYDKSIIKKHIEYNKIVINNDVNKDANIKLDKISYSLFIIKNSLTNIDYNEWFKIVSSILKYAIFLKYSNDNKDLLNDINSYYSSINPKSILDHYIKLIYSWTITAYNTTDNLDKDLFEKYSKMSKVQLELIAKDMKISNYRKTLKKDLIKILSKSSKSSNNYKEDNEKHYNNIINITKYYENQYISNKETNYYERSINILYNIVKIYSSNYNDVWNINNIIKKSLDFSNSNFISVNNYPKYNDKLFYKQIEGQRYIYLQAFMGMNKSGNIENIILNNPNSSFLIISSRVSLANTLLERFNTNLNDNNKFNIYKTNNKLFDGFDDLTKIHRFICSPESIWRITKNMIYDYVIIDELDCFSESIVSDTMRNSGLYSLRINKILSILKDTKISIILAEAIPSLTSNIFLDKIRELTTTETETKETIKAFITDEKRFTQQYNLKDYIYTNDKPTIDKSINKFINDIIIDIKKGYNISGYISNKRTLIYIYEILKKYTNKILIIHADNRNGNNHYIKDPSLITEMKYKVFLYTGTISVGVSQDTKNYWNCKYALYISFGNLTNKCINVNTFLQSLERIRYIKSGVFQQTNIYIIDKPNYKHRLTIDNYNLNNDVNNQFIIDKKNEKYLYKKCNLDIDEIDIFKKIVELEQHYKNGLIDKTLIIDELNNTEYYNYIGCDNNSLLKIDKYLYYKFTGLGLLFDDKTEIFIKQMIIYQEQKNNINKKYFIETLKQSIIKQGNIWNDNKSLINFNNSLNIIYNDLFEGINNIFDDTNDMKNKIKIISKYYKLITLNYNIDNNDFNVIRKELLSIINEYIKELIEYIKEIIINSSKIDTNDTNDTNDIKENTNDYEIIINQLEIDYNDFIINYDKLTLPNTINDIILRIFKTINIQILKKSSNINKYEIITSYINSFNEINEIILFVSKFIDNKTELYNILFDNVVMTSIERDYTIIKDKDKIQLYDYILDETNHIYNSILSLEQTNEITIKKYYEIINKINNDNDPYYNDDEKRLIEYVYINNYFHNLINPYKINSTIYEVIKSLIIKYYDNHHLKHNEYNFNINSITIKRIDELGLFKIKDLANGIDTINIDGRKLDINDKIITELYEDYILKTKLNKPRKDKKTITKLDFLISNLYGLSIDTTKTKRIRDGKDRFENYQLYQFNNIDNKKNEELTIIEQNNLIIQQIFKLFIYK